MTESYKQKKRLLGSRRHTIGEVDGKVVDVGRVVDVEQVKSTSPTDRRTVDDPAFAVQSP